MDRGSKELIRNTRALFESNDPSLRELLQLEGRRTHDGVNREITQLIRYLNSLEHNWDELRFEEPYGNSIVLGSCVWPAFHLVQFGLALLLTGNRALWKPSERVTDATVRLHERLIAVDSNWRGLRVQPGDREVGRQLVGSNSFDLILFQGTYEAGMRIQQDTLPQPGREVLLYLGAKNPIVFLDQPSEPGLEMALFDGLNEGGQSCLSASLIFVEQKYLELFASRFAERAALVAVPLLDSGIQDRYLKFIGIAEKEGADLKLRGRPVRESEGPGRVTPTVSVFQEISPRGFQRSTVLQTEVFGPHVSIVGYRDQNELKTLLSNHSYGLACSVHSKEIEAARNWARDLPFSQIRMNGSLFEINPWMSGRPFRRSGNHGLMGEGLFRQITRSRVMD